MASDATPKVNLFDYTEEQLLEGDELTFYEILSLDPVASSDQVKKAYRKASLKYHPDKTGRGDDDYVFLAVKRAYDCLSDPVKRQAYDSTTIPFDDSIPPPRASAAAAAASSSSSSLDSASYEDDQFYEIFAPVFERNLRFDALLRPDAVNNKKRDNSNNNNNGRRNNNDKNGKHKAPSLGNDETPMAEVHHFYDYWTHFDSWRDFTAQAAEELQVELDTAESRLEKRWLQREIDKRAKQLKTKENGRIQTLVERAKEADPRLRRERQAQMEAKERAKRERVEAAARQAREKEEQLRLSAQLEQEEKQRRAEEKVAREQQKKQIRKARQSLRKMTSASFEEEKAVWADSYDMGLDVEYLCQNLSLQQLRDLTEEFQAEGAQGEALAMIQKRAQAEREAEKADKTSNGAQGASSPTKNDTNTSAASRPPWTGDELSALAKAVKKYPPGGANRWDQIALFVNNLTKSERTREECIYKYNEVARGSSKPATEKGSVAATPTKDTSATTSAAEQSNTLLTTASTDTNTTATTNTTAPPAGARDQNTDQNTTTAAAAAADSPEQWSSEQDQQLQDALAKFPASMDKNERWKSIAQAVPGKTKKQCVERFKAIREALMKSRK